MLDEKKLALPIYLFLEQLLSLFVRAIRARTTHVVMPSVRTKQCKFAWLNEEREPGCRLARRRPWLVLRRSYSRCTDPVCARYGQCHDKLKSTHGKLIIFGCTPSGCSAIPSIKSSSNWNACGPSNKIKYSCLYLINKLVIQFTKYKIESLKLYFCFRSRKVYII